ncbi:hypothetical protein [Pseudomonas sp. HMWF006]|uniref:hypothetical protein n=1 Tax=Pseudomonas sp. HMWF006 TaxID=2056843 RepID=UPI001304B1AA|nr:hypothetical protein [Pseudomonas sp. HMWF006]
MPIGNKLVDQPRSLATASPLDAETWADFVKRLRHDYVVAGRARAIFDSVPSRRYIY